MNRQLLLPARIALACLLLGTAAARGQSAAATDSAATGGVEALVADVLARAPTLAALRERSEAAAEGAGAAGALPDPMVGLMLQDVGFPSLTVGSAEMSMAGVELTQGLLWPGKRRARAAAAGAQAGMAVAESAAWRRRLAAEARGLGARLYALDGEREALGGARELLDLLAATVTARYAAGEGDQEAVLKQQLAASRLEERLNDLAAERAGVVAELNRLRGQPGATPIGTIAALPEVAAPALPAGAPASAAPEVTVRRAAAQAAAARLDLAQVERRPNLVAGAGYGYRDGLDPVVTLRLGVELPLWSGRKQAPLARAAAHELAAANHDLAAAAAAADAEAAGLAAAWRRDEAQVTLYREAILPRTSAALDAARANYLAGRADFATVVEDFTLWLDARIELARREADRFTVWARLEALVDGAGKE